MKTHHNFLFAIMIEKFYIALKKISLRIRLGER